MNQSRRQFFKKTIGFFGVAAVAPTLLQVLASAKAKAADAVKFVIPGQGMAASINYAENKSKVKKELQTDRQGVKFAGQSCQNCQLYTKAADKHGKCALFPNEMVKSDAWCSSWSKKA